jgi:VanZ family protein
MKDFSRYQLPAIIYAILIFIGSALHRVPSPDLGITWFDKIEHFSEYFIFSLLVIRALKYDPVALKGKSLFILAFLLCVFYAGTDEFHQIYVPGRDADIFDLMADSVGILCGAFCYPLLARFAARRNRSAGRAVAVEHESFSQRR